MWLTLKKFPEFVQQVYMDSIGTSPFGDPMMQPKQWVTGLENTGILNLVEIPHFGRGKEVNNCVKQLMAVLHGGFLWMEEPVSIDVELIAFITGLPSMGESPTQYLDDKTKEKALAEEMKKTYGTKRGSCGIIIKRISDASHQDGHKTNGVQIAMQVPQGGGPYRGCRNCNSVCK
jgi:hypothetical protein